MVLVQSWTVHKAQLPLHRAVGKSSLILFPFLIGGLAAIIDLTGKGFVAGDDPVRTMFGGEFLIGLALAIAAYVTLYYRALKYRRKVWVHSGYMLATPLILFESPFSRVHRHWIPAPAVIRGPQDFDRVHADRSCGRWRLELAVIAALWFRFREKANPFLVAGGLHRRADADHGPDERQCGAGIAADDHRQHAERGGGPDRLRHRRGDQLGRMAGGEKAHCPGEGGRGGVNWAAASR